MNHIRCEVKVNTGANTAPRDDQRSKFGCRFCVVIVCSSYFTVGQVHLAAPKRSTNEPINELLQRSAHAH